MSTPPCATRTTTPPEHVPATTQRARWFVDENSLGVAKALAYVRGDITWPGAPDGPVLGRGRGHRLAPRAALLDAGVRACFLTSGGSLTLFDQLRLWLRYWDDIETLVVDHPAPWLASVTRTGVRIFETRPPSDTSPAETS